MLQRKVLQIQTQPAFLCSLEARGVVTSRFYPKALRYKQPIGYEGDLSGSIWVKDHGLVSCTRQLHFAMQGAFRVLGSFEPVLKAVIA